MRNFIFSFIFSFLVYLALTAGSGNLFYWSREEIIWGAVVALITGLTMGRFLDILGRKIDSRILNPLRWGLFLIYFFGPFLFALVKANLTVAYRVLNKKINPGIVKISPGLKTDLGITMLADSITLTPGTLSVDIDKENNLYIHWLYVESKEPEISQVAGNLAKWIKRITE